MSDDHTPCPACDGQGEPLGALGSLMHYRCRQCGWTWSEPAQAEPATPRPDPTVRKGRAKTTGRFETREELEAAVLMYCRRQSIAQVARTCRVSETVVRRILE